MSYLTFGSILNYPFEGLNRREHALVLSASRMLEVLDAGITTFSNYGLKQKTPPKGRQV